MSKLMKIWSSRHTKSVSTSVLRPQWNPALNTGSFHPLPAARVQNLRAYSATSCFPCLTVNSCSLTSLPLGLWSNTRRNISVKLSYEDNNSPSFSHTTVARFSILWVCKLRNSVVFCETCLSGVIQGTLKQKSFALGGVSQKHFKPGNESTGRCDWAC